MPNTDATQVITPTSSPVHHTTLFNLSALRQRSNALLQQAPHPRRTEVSELLHRHYEDKSLIDEWTSWSYDLSFWQKSSISVSVISIAGLSGAVLGLASPFIAIASSLLYAIYTLLNNHEQHRRDRGVRFVAETAALTEQMDSMVDQFRLIAAEMTTALEKVYTQAAEMLEQNTAINERTSELDQNKAELQDILTVVSELSERKQKVQNAVVAVVEGIATGLHQIRPHIDETACAIHDFKGKCDQFAETTARIHHTETRLEVISKGLQDCVKRIPTAQQQQAAQSEPEFDDVILSAQNALAKARALREERQKNRGSSNLILSM